VFESQPYTKRTATAEALKLLFTRCSRPLTVGQNGIEAFPPKWYGSIELAPYFGQKVMFRYRPANIGEIYVFSFPEGRYIATVERRDATGVSSQDYRRIQKERKALKQIARSYQVKREATAAMPDPIAALAAATRYENDRRRNTEPQTTEAPAPAAPQKVVRVATAMEFAARRVKADRKTARRAEVARPKTEALEDRLYREAVERQERAREAKGGVKEAEEKLDNFFKISERFGR
jgi:hypothetical protein